MYGSSPPPTAWVERVIRLPAGSAAEPGPIKLYPYQRGIAAAIFDDATKIPQSVQLIGPPSHHLHPLLPEFGGMRVGATDFVRLLMR